MTFSFTKLNEELKKVKKEDYAYLSVLLIFASIVCIVFSMTASFLSGNINKVFSSYSNETVRALDMEQYTLIAKKLHFSIPISGTNEANQPLSSETSPQATTTQPFDKQSLVLKVLNGTKNRSGLAATLSEALAKDGFMVLKSGNEDEPYATTTLFLLTSKKDYEASLMKVIRTLHPNAIATTTDKNNGYDALIIIGQD